MTDVTIAHLQQYLHDRHHAWADETDMFMKLMEEVGEVAESLNARAGRKKDDGVGTNAHLGEELADVIHYAVAIAAINHIDLTQVILDKDIRASKKYHHTINLTEFIAQQGEVDAH